MSRHPLLSLQPAARRHLARTLVEGLAADTRADRARRLRHGLLSGAACLVAGGGLGLGWSLGAGGAWQTFALVYGGWLGVQGVVGARLAGRRLPASAPAALTWAVFAPYEAVSGLGALAPPPRLPADRLVLAAGVLVAVRHPLSYHLLRRLYGRAYPQVEVERAVQLLGRLGYLTSGEGEAAGLLVLTPEGARLLHGLGVPAPTPRPQREPRIAAHLAPLFKRFELAGRPRPEPMPRPVVVPRPKPRPSPDTEPPKKPARVTSKLEPLAKRRRWRGPVLAAVVLAALAGLAAWGLLQHSGPKALKPMHVTASLMPHSRGAALAFNGRGLLLSSFGGGLFLSIPDRLDYKRPLSFKGFDMASDCGLSSQGLKRVSMSPHGRFLLAEIGSAGGPKERCLIDLETKTVTHDLAAREAIYGLPGVVGWRGAQGLVLSAEPPERRPDRWWWIDVTNGEKRPLLLPRHGRVLPLPGEGGTLQALGLDMHQRGSWDMTTYWLDGQHEYRKIRTVRATFPEALKEAEPLTAALSPDKRFVLLTLRTLGASEASLLVVALESGQTEAPRTAVAPLPDQPIFWGPEPRGGKYRFYFNGETPDGVSPWTGELRWGER